ncbi:hypothetical protein BDY19DRAFT_531931 [Irpex rosettiformis]|uniref:Uncharacterized protein n=1 Tax=Irpex rosettiformis TaxID=378272 RepID=A0ACB8TR06_9APHY|nr:hypothetical protein BDY19DRAFT_531931 [Irpex rosettiformis]
MPVQFVCVEVLYVPSRNLEFIIDRAAAKEPHLLMAFLTRSHSFLLIQSALIKKSTLVHREELEHPYPIDVRVPSLSESDGNITRYESATSIYHCRNAGLPPPPLLYLKYVEANGGSQLDSLIITITEDVQPHCHGGSQLPLYFRAGWYICLLYVRSSLPYLAVVYPI